MSQRVYFIVGIPERINGAPECVELSQVFGSEEQARAELGVVMLLSRMTHGDQLADCTSWFPQTADVGVVLPSSGEHFVGYRLDDRIMCPVAGGWKTADKQRNWAPFVRELERLRAADAELPW